MTPAVRLGLRHGPFRTCLDEEFLRRFASATSDPSPLVRSGEIVSPVALATAIWDMQEAGRRAVVSEALQRSARTGVHGEHDVLLHRPVAPGEPLEVWIEACGARPAGRNAVVTLRYSAFDADGRLVAEQWWSTVYVAVTCEAVGVPPPDHAFPSDARARRMGSFRLTVDPDMARRYAAASGDWSAHHFDAEAARRAGYHRPFLHGVCTMALCAQGVTAVAADGDQRRLRRFAVRFTAPVFLGEDVEVDVYRIDGSCVAFEARSAGATVISHGRAELW